MISSLHKKPIYLSNYKYIYFLPKLRGGNSSDLKFISILRTFIAINKQAVDAKCGWLLLRFELFNCSMNARGFFFLSRPVPISIRSQYVGREKHNSTINEINVIIFDNEKMQKIKLNH